MLLPHYGQVSEVRDPVSHVDDKTLQLGFLKYSCLRAVCVSVAVAGLNIAHDLFMTSLQRSDVGYNA